MSKTMSEIPYTLDFILGSMSNKARIEESLLFSGVDQLELLIDIEMLLEEAMLTEKQLQVVELYYFKQYTQEEVSKVLGISQQGVLDHLKKVKQKIEKVLKRWEKLDEKQFNNR